jgi:MYXO-CTERM domain-containing protein
MLRRGAVLAFLTLALTGPHSEAGVIQVYNVTGGGTFNGWTLYRVQNPALVTDPTTGNLVPDPTDEVYQSNFGQGLVPSSDHFSFASINNNNSLFAYRGDTRTDANTQVYNQGQGAPIYDIWATSPSFQLRNMTISFTLQWDPAVSSDAREHLAIELVLTGEEAAYNPANVVTLLDYFPAAPGFNNGDSGTDYLGNLHTLDQSGRDSITLDMSRIAPMLGISPDLADGNIRVRWGDGDLAGDGNVAEFDTFSMTPLETAAAPEPSTALLALAGIAALAGHRSLRKRVRPARARC